MGVRDKLMAELAALAQAGLYFTVWLGALMVLKKLILEEYRIEFHGLTLALMGALVLSKVVLLLENVPLGRWTRDRAAWVDVVLRTALYTIGVFVVLVLEKGLEGRHEHGGFVPALTSGFAHLDVNHVWVNTICLGGALLGFNVLTVIRRQLGEGGLRRLFFAHPPDETPASRTSPT